MSLALALALALSPALSPAAEAADTVRVSGVVEYTGSGPIRLELLNRSEGEALLIWSGSAPGAGPFAVDVPSHLGEVTLRAAADQQRDGVGPDDPQCLIGGLLIVDKPVSDLTVTLKPPERTRAAGAPATER